MAANLANHDPIRVYQTVTNTTEQTQDYPEAAGQTFLDGVPVQLAAAPVGYVKEWNGTPSTPGVIIGVSSSAAMNLPTSGAGQPPSFGSYGFPGSPTAYGTVPNQPPAVNIPAGATFSTGATTVFQAVDETIFIAQVDSASGGAYTPSVANVGLQYGLTKDATGHWYIDLDKFTVGTNTCVLIVGLYPNDLASGSSTTEVPGGHLLFKFVLAQTAVEN